MSWSAYLFTDHLQVIYTYKISHLEAYNAIYKHDIFCISERQFLIPQSQKETKIYNLMVTVWSGQTIQVIQNEVEFCIFCKEILALCVVNSLNFNECDVCEVSIQNSKGYIGVIYRSPNQNIIEFENVLSDFEKLLNCANSSNGLFTIILGNFNARSSVWCRLKIKQQLKAHNLNLLQVCMGFTNLYYNPFIYYPNLHLVLT